ncbi:HD domain-containing protein [Desulfurobacterium sp.]
MKNLKQLESKLKKIINCVKDGYIVGGALRDFLLEMKDVKDIDIVIPGDFYNTIHCVEKATSEKGFFYAREKPVYTFYLNDIRIDITKLQGTIEEDLSQRDFTINAIAYSLKKKELIDPLNGTKDLQKKILHPISLKVFEKDPIRILRGIRIKTELHLSYSKKFIEGAKRSAYLIKNEPKERIREELTKILKLENAHKAFRDMRKLNALYSIFPELSEEEKIPPSGLHQYPLIIHTLKTVEYICDMFKQPEKINHKFIEEVLNLSFSGNISGRELLIITALLHDIGKPLTVKEKNGYLTFYNHDKIGSEIAEKRLLTVGFGKKSAYSARKIIELHLRPFFLFQLFKEKRLSQKAIYNFIRAAGFLLPLIVIHSVADFKATSRKMEENASEFIWFLNEKVINFYLKVKSIKPLLSGKEIMEIKGLKEGKAVGRIKDKLIEFQALGRIKTKEEAIKAVKGFST